MGSYPGGIRRDYKNAVVEAAARPTRRWPLRVVGLMIALFGGVLFLLGTGNETAAVIEPGSRSLAADVSPGVPRDHSASAAPTAAEDASARDLVRMTVGRGDSLERMFRRYGLSLGDLSAMAQLPGADDYLQMLDVGNEIIVAHQAGRVRSLEREIDELNVLSIVREPDGFAVDILQRPVELRTVGVHGVIEHSLFKAARDAGLSDPITMNMAKIFQWDIDFLQDVRAGDEFTVIYEELWRDGEKLRDREILAAEFINQGIRYRAARYTNESGFADYFTPEGRSVRKAFIRAPVDFTRISSSFDSSRRHPVLNTIRAHRGVDYAAPTGTPIRAAGDGKISFRAARNGYGNTVILEHGINITTLYAHMSRFADIHVGGRVKQGQIIGYVGMSGLATGPHLHYEYRVDGVHQNPQTVALPSADPLPLTGQDEFRLTVASLWRQLDLYRRAQFRATAAN